MSDADETRDRLAEIRARLFVERTGDEFVAHAPADVAWLLEECERSREDVTLAAGELLVPIPEAGTVAARLLSANVLLKRECERLRGERDERTRDPYGLDMGAPSTRLTWTLA